MPYTITWEPHGVVKRYCGFVSGAEFVQSVIAITASRQFDELGFIINDFLAADDHSINRESFEEFAVMRYGAAQTRSNIRTAIITTAPEFAAIATAVNGALPDGVPKTEVFPTLEAARLWLAQQPQLLGDGKPLRGFS